MAVELTPERLARADWDDVLRELTAGMDPWDIDLVLLLRRFREFLGKLRALELEIPGRMLLVGSVLLRLKAECLGDGNGHGADEDAGKPEAVTEETGGEVDYPDVYIGPEFRLPLPRRPRRKVTIRDLERALRLALAQEKRKGRRPTRRPSLPLRIRGESFSKRAARLLRKLLSMVNGRRDVPFEALLERGEPGEVVARFLELLHLDREGKVILRQRRFLGKLIVEVPPHVGAKGRR